MAMSIGFGITQSFFHLFIPSFIQSFTHSFIHSFAHLFIQPFIHSFIHSFIPSFNELCIESFRVYCIAMYPLIITSSPHALSILRWDVPLPLLVTISLQLVSLLTRSDAVSWWFDALLRFWWRRWLRPWSLTSGGSVFPSDLTFGSWDSELYHPPSRTLFGLLVTQIITDLRVVITGDLWIRPPPSRPAFGSFAMQVVMILHTSTTPDQSLVGIFSVVKFSVIDSPLNKKKNWQKKERKKTRA